MRTINNDARGLRHGADPDTATRTDGPPTALVSILCGLTRAEGLLLEAALLRAADAGATTPGELAVGATALLLHLARPCGGCDPGEPVHVAGPAAGVLSVLAADPERVLAAAGEVLT